MSDHERFDIPNADVLLGDVWAEESNDTVTCRECGANHSAVLTRCPECCCVVPVCIGVCAACISPVCVGDPQELRAR